MKYRTPRFDILLVLIMTCSANPTNATPKGPAERPAERVNPLLSGWDTPFGVPPFDRIENTDYLPAMRAAMAAQKAEIGALLGAEEPPSFANTIEALERSGELLRRVDSTFSAVEGAHSNETLREVAKTLAPEVAAHTDDILLNEDLFRRVHAVFEKRGGLELDAEQTRLLEETHKRFVRAGAGLSEENRERLRTINAEIASLSQDFNQNLLAETNDYELHVTAREDLGSLPESLVAAAAEEARRRGHDGGWSFTLARPSINPFLQYSPNRDLRRRIFTAYCMRGDHDNERDNKKTLVRLATLRTERANLLGYATHADYVLADNVAETPQRVYELLDRVWKPALAVAKTEREDLEARMHDDGVEGDLEGWDWRYYSEKVRKARFDLDEEQMRPYFEVNAVRDGAFRLAGRLFGLTFSAIDLPTWHPDQQVFEVKEADGRHLGILYMDFFARESKRGGAWMNALRVQSRQNGEVTPIVTNNFNFPPPAAGSPSLLSWTEASTLFHELGHALHGLLSDVTYASLAGTQVPRDFVEFPSQVIENWLSEPEVLRWFAKHYKTGEPIPDELIDKIQAAAKFNQGFATVEYLAAAYLDMAWHTLSEPEAKEPRAFERAEMERIGLIEQIPPRYRSEYFRHIFAGGYSAGYYGYLWSEVMDADAFEAFRETSLFDPTTATKYRRLLSQGGSRPGLDLYREFRGREPAIEPLLERRGLKESSDNTSQASAGRR